MSLGNSIQAYSTLHYTAQVYNGPKGTTASPATALQSRTFGTWTFITALFRLYAAYHLDNPDIYRLTFCVFCTAFGHFASEWLIFKTAHWGRGLAGPVIVSSSTMLWMILEWPSHVK